MALLALRRDLAQSGPKEVLQAIDRFLDALRLQQFHSSEPQPAPGRGEWINLNMPLRLPPDEAAEARQPGYCEARLRIARHRQGEESEVDPNFTRLIIGVDLEDGGTLEVDLSVVKHLAGVAVTATNSALCDTAKEEISSLAHGLSQLGYDLQSSRFEIEAAPKSRKKSADGISPERFFAVNLEI
jgi:hypothetical protein